MLCQPYFFILLFAKNLSVEYLYRYNYLRH